MNKILVTVNENKYQLPLSEMNLYPNWQN